MINIKKAREVCEVTVQPLPWLVRISVDGFVTVVDADGMWVGDFGCGSAAEAELTAEATRLLPQALDEIERLRGLLLEACGHAAALDDGQMDTASKFRRDCLASIRRKVEGSP